MGQRTCRSRHANGPSGRDGLAGADMGGWAKKDRQIDLIGDGKVDDNNSSGADYLYIIYR